LIDGGRDGYTVLADTWLFDGTTWRSVPNPIGRPQRHHHSLTFDSESGHVVAFGGLNHWLDYILTMGDTWEWQPASIPTWTRLGRGCLGSAGTPSLDLVGVPPTLGSSLQLQVSALPLQSGALVLALGFGIAELGQVPLPLTLSYLGMPDCQLWIAPEPTATFLYLHAGQSFVWSSAIPANPALAGLSLASQVLVFDGGAPNGIGATTNAGVLTIW
jgi:hypothetical protein